MATPQRRRVSSVFLLTMFSITSCHVRVASLGSVALRYTRARPRLIDGWRSVSFMA